MALGNMYILRQYYRFSGKYLYLFLRQNFIDAATFIVLLTQYTIPVKDTRELGAGID
jgi:hypothetical protein